MTQPKVGLSSFIGFVEQSGYTTRVLPSTKFLPLISGGDSLAREDARIETAGIDSIGYSSTRTKKGRLNVTGSEEFEVLYEGAELVFKHIFGQVTTSQPDPSNAPNVYDHTFEIADSLPLGLTVEVNRGGTSFFVTGANIQSAQISQDLDQFMRLSVDIIGRDYDTGTASTDTIPTTNAFSAPDAILQWNGNALQCSNFSVQINNNLDDNRVFIGSRLRKQPVRASRIEVTGSFEIEFTDLTVFNDFTALTQRELLIQSIGATIEGGFNNEFNLTLPITELTAAPIQVSDEGRITYSAEFKSLRSSSQNEVKLVMRNTVTSV